MVYWLDPFFFFTAAALLALMLRRGRLAGWILAVLMVLMLAPVGNALTWELENRMSAPDWLSGEHRVDGIILLGGDERVEIARLRGQASMITGARAQGFAALARHYPGARLFITGGGKRSPIPGTATESSISRQAVIGYGIDPARLEMEEDSLNTWDNAMHSYAQTKPEAGQTWILVTTAAHMPRALAAFKAAGWGDMIQPAPVDFRAVPPQHSWKFVVPASNLSRLHYALREYLAGIWYRLNGRAA
ncbi:MAG: YdcF family protein [Alphaproteobacteria bacterium]|nr:MAG: YdcF family protein [Alphaproteobacteria bacterium]